MPGIVGVFSPGGMLSETENLIASMCGAIQHMPNQKVSRYRYADRLLFGRVDLGIFRHNIKPKEAEGIVAFIWGELLNPQRERRELLKGSPFEGKEIDDIDFLIGLYKKTRGNFAGYLRGSFNAFIFDEPYKKLTIANDRFGLRPLYYYCCKNKLIFSSEVKAILRCNEVKKTINLAGLADFFHYGFLTGNKTLFEGIERMPSGTILTYTDTSHNRKQYWDLAFTDEEGGVSADDYADQLAGVIKDCVRANAEGELRFGLPLSGGLDSRTIAACIPKEKYPVLVYTWGVPGSPEVHIAKEVTDRLGLEHHNTYRTPEQFVKNFRKSVLMTDGMIPGNLPLANFLFEDAFMPYVDVCFDGLQSICIIPPLGRAPLKGDDSILGQAIPSAPKDLLKLAVSDRYYKTFEDLAALSREEIKNSTATSNPINRYHYFDIKQSQMGLHNFGLLVKRNFVEVRTPLFDYPVIDVVRKIPPALRNHRYIYYKAFCHISPQLAKIKTVGTMYPVSYPYWLQMLGRVKKGLKTRIYHKLSDSFGIKHARHNQSDWGIDYSSWYSESETVKGYITETLAEKNVRNCEYLNPQGVRKIIDAQFGREQNCTSMVNRLLTNVIWSEMFL